MDLNRVSFPARLSARERFEAVQTSGAAKFIATWAGWKCPTHRFRLDPIVFEKIILSWDLP